MKYLIINLVKLPKKTYFVMLALVVAFAFASLPTNANVPLSKEQTWGKLSPMLDRYGNTWTSPSYTEVINPLMTQGALLGNGDVGVVSYGTISEKTYLISKSNFWSYGYNMDAAQGLDLSRVTPLSLGGITLKSSGNTTYPSGQFEEHQSITTGELCTSMNIGGVPLIMNAWVASDNNLFIVEIASKGTKSAQLELKVWTNGDQAVQSNPKLFGSFPTQSGVESSKTMAWASRKSLNNGDAPESWISEALLSAKIIGGTGKASMVSASESKIEFTLGAGKTIYAIVSVGGGGKTYDHTNTLIGTLPSKEASALLAKVNSSADLKKLSNTSKDWWKKYWLSSYVDIGDEVLQKYYYGSLYYMGAGTRKTALPPGLYGIWTTTDAAKWNGDYHMNYNYIAPYYGLYSSNRCDHAFPAKDPLIDYLPEGKKRAQDDLQKIYKNYITGGAGTAASGVTFPGRPDLLQGISNGALYSVAIGPWGSTTWSKNGGYLMQMSNAAFSTQAITAYYAYTLDEEYIKEVYPLLEANALFFEKWCEKENLGNGKYRYIIWSGAHEETFDLNAPNVVGCVKNILQCLIKASELNHIHPSKEKLAVWKDMEEHFAQIPVETQTVYENSAGISAVNGAVAFDKPIIPLSEKGVKLWGGSATINLEFIHPSEQLGFDSDPILLDAARNSIDLIEKINPNTWIQANNTPKIYIEAIRAGYDPNHVMSSFRTYLNNARYKKNFTIEDGSHGIEKAGAIEFINNMLLQSCGGFIKVFPNWTNKNASFANLREKGAFLISSEMVNGKILYITLTSEKGTKARIVTPWAKTVVKDASGNHVESSMARTVNSGEQIVIFETKPGKSYRIESGL